MANEWTLFDGGIFIGALLLGDPRHAEPARRWKQLDMVKHSLALPAVFSAKSMRR